MTAGSERGRDPAIQLGSFAVHHDRASRAFQVAGKLPGFDDPDARDADMVKSGIMLCSFDGPWVGLCGEDFGIG